MSMTDPLGDMIARIRNGGMAHKSFVTVPASNLRANVLDVLKREGYIRGYERVSVRTGVDEFKVELKYFENQENLITNFVKKFNYSKCSYDSNLKIDLNFKTMSLKFWNLDEGEENDSGE